jgi:hypothetical protein
MAEAVLQFLFILILPLIVVAAVIGGLFAVGALFDALENPENLRARVEGAFRRPPKAARATAENHYYRPYWKSP